MLSLRRLPREGWPGLLHWQFEACWDSTVTGSVAGKRKGHVPLAGRGTETQAQAQEATGAILQQGVREVLVKRGTSGSLLVRQDGECLVQPIFKATQVQASCW